MAQDINYGQQMAPGAETLERPTIAPPSPPNTGARNLDTLVAQYFERLEGIINTAIKQLEELRAHVPHLALKDSTDKPLFFTFSGGIVTDHYGHLPHVPCGDRCKFRPLPSGPQWNHERDTRMHDTKLCRAEHKNCKCPCASCISNCTRRPSPHG